MMFRIVGADPDTQERIEIYWEAPDAEAAGRIATGKGILTSSIEPMPLGQPVVTENEAAQDRLKDFQRGTVSPLGWLAILAGGLVGTTLIVQIVSGLIKKDEEHEVARIGREAQERRENSFKKQNETLAAWLDCQRKGETGYEYWLEKSWVTKVRLFALQSSEVVDQSGCDFTVRIHSSTKGGTPVVCLWRVTIGFDGRIHSVKENEEWLKEKEALDMLVKKKIGFEEYIDRLNP